MGQSHQAFVIARIRPVGGGPPRFRCIAAFHHQWCYGRLPLRATRRFITLAKQKNNADIIKAEIRAIEERCSDSQKLSSISCPFIAFLLASSWTTDLEDPKKHYSSGGSFCSSILDTHIRGGGYYSNDGITVIDVTDPLSPAYCLVFPGIIGADEGTPMWRPVSAADYVHTHCPKSTSKDLGASCCVIEDDALATIESLGAERLVDTATLAETWPRECQQTLKKTDKTVSPIANSSDRPFVKPLADLMLGPAVITAIKTDETAIITKMLWLPGKCAQVRAILRQQAPFSDTAATLMGEIIALEMKSSPDCIDLQELALSPEQVIRLLTPFAETLTTLDLSYNPYITVVAIRSILVTAPRLKRLVVLGCTSIVATDLGKLLENDPKLFYHLEALIHPLFFRRLIDISKNLQYPFSFSFIALHSQMAVRAGALPIFTPTSVVQALTDWLQCFCDSSPMSAQALLSNSLAPLSAFSAVPRNARQKWSERTVACIPQFSLRGLEGHGWVFGFKFDYSSRRYGFMRFKREVQAEREKQDPTEGIEKSEQQPAFNEPAVRYQGIDSENTTFACSPVEIQGLRGFLDVMVAEGRPRAPEHSVKKLEVILQRLQKDAHLELFQKPEAQEFASRVNLIYQVMH